MAGIRDIKRQIVSVQNTQKVTKAMKMISAVKMRKATEAMQATRPYAAKIRDVMENLSSRMEEANNPFLKIPKEVKTVALLAINADRGLCGAFNTNIIRMISTFHAEHPDKSLKLFIIGKNAYNFYKKRTFPIIEKWITFGGKISYETAKKVSNRLSEGFLNKEFDELYVVYNEFRSVSAQVAKAEKLLPLVFQKNEEEQVEYICEPNSAELLEAIVPKYIDFFIYHSLLESTAGEHGARMVAMDGATRSADEMIKKLTLYYNKARQAAITTDLLDIVNGAEALK